MPILPMYFFPDEPVCDEDLLGFGDFVDLIYGAIERTQTSFVYGVLGDWGTGKTSTLNMRLL